MNLNSAIELFKNLLATAGNKMERKVYASFINMLEDLAERDFNDQEITLINSKLDELDLANPVGKQRSYYRKQYLAFTCFLKGEFGLLPEDHYMNMGVSLGVAMGSGLGVAIGTAFGSTGTSMGISMGVGIGLAIGIAIGSQKDKEAKRQCKTFRVK